MEPMQLLAGVFVMRKTLLSCFRSSLRHTKVGTSVGRGKQKVPSRVLFHLECGLISIIK